MSIRHLGQGLHDSVSLFAIHVTQESESQMDIPGRHDPHAAQPPG